MNLYKVIIRSRGNGWTDEKVTEGELFETQNKVKLVYALDGDNCVLEITEGRAVQTRRGEQCLKITFEEGKYSDCVIGEGNMSGSYKIFTRKIEFLRGKNGFSLSLEYENGSDREIINLKLTAHIKEKK